MGEKIIIKISPSGEILIEGEGFQGDACDAALDPYVRQLGAARETRRKPEYFRRVSHGRIVRVGDE